MQMEVGIETGLVSFRASFLYDLRQAMQEQNMWRSVRNRRTTIFIDQHENRQKEDENII